MDMLPRAGSGVERIDSLRFLAGCRKRRLNQALSVLSLILDCFSVSVVLLKKSPFCDVLFCYFLVVLLGGQYGQVIDWKDSSLK